MMYKPPSPRAPPPQWLVLLANVTVITNFIVALLVAWVDPNLPIVQTWFSIFVPIKLGLIKCFSDICDVKTKGVNIPGNIPGGKQPGNDQQGSGGGNAKVPFEIAAILAIILLSIGTLLVLASIALEVLRVQGKPQVKGTTLPLHATVLATLVVLVAGLQYLFITLGYLNGGSYDVGFWLTIGTAVLTGVLCFAQLIVNNQYPEPQEVQRLFYTSSQNMPPGTTYSTVTLKQKQGPSAPPQTKNYGSGGGQKSDGYSLNV